MYTLCGGTSCPAFATSMSFWTSESWTGREEPWELVRIAKRSRRPWTSSLKALVTDFRRSGRILVPTASVYEEAGEVLRRLQAEMGYGVSGASSLVNDVLIALSARSIGATVITQNRGDFEAIQTTSPFKLAIVS